MRPLLLLCLASFSAFAQSPAPTDSARLQGAWRMVSASADGQEMPPEMAATMSRVFTGSMLTVTMDGQPYMAAHVILNPSASPKTIDYHMTGGPTAGSTQLGIYEFRGDTVRFIFGAPNAPRPKDFTSAPGDQRTLSAWVKSAR